MSVSIFQESASNVSAIPVNYPPLSPPDVSNCHGYYSYPTPPLLADCREAFKLLPSGTVPTLWYTEPVAGEQRNVLPLEVHHGTCQIIFHASGQSAASVDHFSIMPNDIKAMASWVLARCCFFRKGGMVTKGLKNTIDAITADPGVEIFPDPPLPTSSSFYSLHMWNFIESGDDDFNPGNNEPDVGGAICKSLWRAKRAAPEGSPAQVELQRRYEYLWDAVGRMVHDAADNWWDGPLRPGLSSSASRLASNETVGDGDATVV